MTAVKAKIQLYLFLLALTNSIAANAETDTTKTTTEDKPKWIVGVGADFDFLDPTASFKDVIYGETIYYNNGILNENTKRLDMGLRTGGTFGTSLSEEFSTSRFSHNFVPVSDSQYYRVTKTYSSVAKVGFRQLSLFLNPYLVTRVGKNGKLKVGIGPHLELYNVVSFTKYTSNSLEDSTSYLKTVPRGSFIPSGESGLADSQGVSVSYGYYGISIPVIITEEFVHVRANLTLGGVSGKERHAVPAYGNVLKGNAFYYFSVGLTEPRTQISIQGNIRGSFPYKHTQYGNEPAPIYNVYIVKRFNLPVLFKNILSLGSPK